MIVRRLLAWMDTADSARRANGATALANAYLLDGLSESEQIDAETAMTALLDDPAIAVRKAMSRVLAGSPDAPPHIISALAVDHSTVAARILTHSPLLSEEDLIDCLNVADSYAQVALALRPSLPGRVATVIAAQGGREAMIALAVNEAANLSEATMLTMLERHGCDGEVREALLSRASLPAVVRTALAGETAKALQGFVTRTGWLSPQRSERCSRDSRDTAIIEIAAGEYANSGSPPQHLAASLRQNAQLTPSLLLRALVSGERALFEASLCALSGMDTRRVCGLVKAWSGAGFGALYAKAGLPGGLLGAFRAALAAQDATGLVAGHGQRPRLSSLLIERTLRACEASASPELRKVNALLHRLRAEAARAEARVMSMEMIAAARARPLITQVEQPAIEVDLAAIEVEIAMLSDDETSANDAVNSPGRTMQDHYSAGDAPAVQPAPSVLAA